MQASSCVEITVGATPAAEVVRPPKPRTTAARLLDYGLPLFAGALLAVHGAIGAQFSGVYGSVAIPTLVNMTTALLIISVVVSYAPIAQRAAKDVAGVEFDRLVAVLENTNVQWAAKHNAVAVVGKPVHQEQKVDLHADRTKVDLHAQQVQQESGRADREKIRSDATMLTNITNGGFTRPTRNEVGRLVVSVVDGEQHVEEQEGGSYVLASAGKDALLLNSTDDHEEHLSHEQAVKNVVEHLSHEQAVNVKNLSNVVKNTSREAQTERESSLVHQKGTSYEKLELWKCTGGPIGVFIVGTGFLCIPPLGVVAFFMSVTAGQLCSGLVCDRIGFAGLPRRPLSAGRLLSVLIVACGVSIVVLSTAETAKEDEEAGKNDPAKDENHPGSLLFYGLLAISIGVMLPVQASVNAAAQRVLGTPLAGAQVSFFGASFAALFLFLSLDYPMDLAKWEKPLEMWMLTTGVIGGFIVCTTSLLGPRVGQAMLWLLIILGQMLGSLPLDHFGLIGLTPKKVTAARLCGVLVVLCGVGLMALRHRLVYEYRNRTGRKSLDWLL
ncbi:unnamed protein product [Amoebophrya sp. A25]|nr:unnamed protein product [Amoebophrya sp. A25]|eukprot:GSA25T00024510001.1